MHQNKYPLYQILRLKIYYKLEVILNSVFEVQNQS
jgi:hypothetical protein